MIAAPRAPNEEGRTSPELRKRATEADTKLRRLYDALESGVADPTTRYQRLDPERPEDAIKRAGLVSHRRLSRRLPGQPQAHAARWRRRPPRPPTRRRPTGRSRSERTAHQGIEKRASAGRGYFAALACFVPTIAGSDPVGVMSAFAVPGGMTARADASG
jgi:hypothetical protein